ncbi:MAG: DUF3656 domain-containing U32 family peptidase [Thermoplasmatota archaeon]
MPPQRVSTSLRLTGRTRGPNVDFRNAPRVELLAPAGSFEALIAAVENGADAVYLAGHAFGARKFAKNFSDEELRKGVDFAHVRGVRVFVTVNTLVFNEEFGSLLPFLRTIHDAGVDAVIVQDLGIMRILRESFPQLPVHISTQATVHNSAGIRFLEDLGAERVILARENTLKDIQNMKVETKAELEHFVHGAMCYCYSGQCLMSSLIGERSGNRGACAYTCRLPFTMEASEGHRKAGAPPTVIEEGGYAAMPNVREKHVLSAKDLHNLEEIPQLIEAGVTSFKIEGRMKRPEYVAVVTRAYRNAIDRYYEGRFHLTAEERDAVAKIFNREFTPGFLEGKEKWDFTNWDTAGNRGTPLGEVVASGPGWVRIRLAAPLRLHDGIEILHLPRWGHERGGRPEEYGFEVRQIGLPGRGPMLQTTSEARAGEIVELKGEQVSSPGDAVYKTADIETLETARRSYQGAPHRRIPIRLRARLAVGEPIAIHVETVWPRAGYLSPDRGRGPIREGDPCFSMDVASSFIVSPARSAPLQSANVRDVLGRVGESPFTLDSLELDLASASFAPLREINEARRQALEGLEEAISREFHREARPGPRDGSGAAAGTSAPATSGAAGSDSVQRLEVAVNCWTFPNLEAAIRGGATTVYFSGLRPGGLQPKWDEDAIDAAVALAQKNGARIYIASGMIQKDHEIAFLRAAAERHKGAIAGILAGNHGAAHVARDLGLPWIADWPLNVYNSVTVDFLRSHGAERITLSPEMTLAQMSDVAARSTLPLEAISHGRLTLMTSEYCSIGHATACQMPGGTWAPCHDQKYRLNDRVGANFPLETDGMCRMYILNSVELAMINRLPQLAAAGLAVARIETIGTRPEAVEAQVATYRDALSTGFRDAHWERLKALCPEGFTTGHFYRGPA